MSEVRVAVLAGGISSERQISLQSGRFTAEALRQGGYDVVESDISPGDLRILDDKSIDVFFVCLHGQFGEDGQLQKILEEKRLCYTHSDSDASRLAIDKLAAKRHFACAGVNTPQAISFTEQVADKQVRTRFSGHESRFVVKPVSNGSSVGVRVVTGFRAVLKAARQCREEFGDCMIEQFIPGREITVGILNGRALPILEIRPKVGFYDYRAKYLDDETEYLFETVSDPQVIERVSGDALKCFDCLGCRHTARVDFILAGDGTAYALEINTIPGMTEHSCVPKAAAKVGISMVELCSGIVRRALADYKQAKGIAIMEAVAGGERTKEKQAVSKDV